MKRSRSVSSQSKPLRTPPKSKPKPPHKIIVFSTQNTAVGTTDPDQAGLTKTPRNTVQQRLQNIRLGFSTLQKNLNMYKPVMSSLVTSPHHPTSNRKIAKKLYETETSRKDKKSCSTSKNPHPKVSPERVKTARPTHQKTKSKYHTCIYERSLYDLMKIVTLQKMQINKLNTQLKKNNH